MKHSIIGFEHLHLHSDFSLLDGYGMVEEYGSRAKEINQQYLCVSDHGAMGVIPRQIRTCEKNKLSPIFSCELYVNPHQPGDQKLQDFIKDWSDDDKKKARKSYHLLAIATNEIGYKNLVKLSSWGWLHGFYRFPRVNHEQLLKYKEGIIFTSCCYNSEIGQAFDRGGEEVGEEMLLKYMDMFSPNFYLEIMLLDFEKQKPYDAFILKMKDKYGLPVILTNDCFPAGTMILTEHGYRPIETLKIGTKVFTAERRWREVEHVNCREVREDESVYSVKCAIGTELFKVTEEHPICVANWNPSKTKVLGHSWKKVSEVSDQDYLVFPVAEKPFSIEDMDFLDTTEGLAFSPPVRGCECCVEGEFIVSSRGFNHQSRVAIPINLPVDEDLLFVLGWYLAEGSCDPGSYQISFGAHVEEKHITERIRNYFSGFGISFTYGNPNCENGLKLIGSSKVFHSLFRRLCGSGSSKKRFPLRGKLSEKQSLKVLYAYFLGDGHNVNATGSNTAYTTSSQMAWDIIEIASSLGIAKLPEVRDNSDLGWSDGYSIHFGKNASQLLGLGSSTSLSKNTLGMFRRQGNYFYVKVESVTKSKSDFVYNLQVREDESYVANAAAVHNCHYCMKEDSIMQQKMLMVQTNMTIQDVERKMQESGDADLFVMQDQNLYMKSEEELNEKWERDYSHIVDYELFKEAKATTVEVCKIAQGVELDRTIKLPEFDEQDDQLRDAIELGFKKRKLPDNIEYRSRIEEERELICEKGFSSYFLIQQMICDEARRWYMETFGGTGSESQGPGRGSAVGSLTCYCLGITDVDPLKHDLLFSRFLSPARGGKQMDLEFTIDPITKEDLNAVTCEAHNEQRNLCI